MQDIYKELALKLNTAHVLNFQAAGVNRDINFPGLNDETSANSRFIANQYDVLLLTLIHGSGLGTVAFTYFESDDGASWTEITSDTTLWRRTTPVGDSTALNHIHQYLGTKKYFRVTITPADFGATATLMSLIVCGPLRYGQ
jgi:hypothetical protein